LLAAFNAFVKVLDAFFNISAKHIVYINLFAASMDNLIADFGQKTLETIRSVVVAGKLPNNAHIIQNFG
jgi:hypothetical protein